jgi:hypothetical protein
MRSCTDAEIEKVNRCIRKVFGLGTHAIPVPERKEADEPKTVIEQKDVQKLTTERDIYKQMYEDLLERMIAR